MGGARRQGAFARNSIREDNRIRRGGDGGLVAGKAGIGLGSIACDLIKEPSVDPLCPPILQAHPAFLTYRERHALFGHLAFGSYCVTQLIDENVIEEGHERFLVALKSSVSLDPIIDQQHTQARPHPITRRLAEILDNLDDGVCISA